jgi:RNA polymerase sigma factor (TIGR02999 family)
MVYRELRALAYQLFRGQQPGHTLQPTALVHEVYLRLANQSSGQQFSREEFFAAAARMIRYILVDHARARLAAKRGGGRIPVPLSEFMAATPAGNLDLMALNDALDKLADLDPPKAALIELRFFGGLSMEETARVLQVAPRSLYREWTIAKAWLQRELDGGSPDDT